MRAVVLAIVASILVSFSPLTSAGMAAYPVDALSGTSWPDGVLPWLDQKVVAPDGGQGDQFGWAGTIDGDTAMVAAFVAPVDGILNQGAVYVFERKNGLWLQTQKLVVSDATGVITFGSAIALDGDTAIIGATEATVDSPRQGAAYVFTRSAGIWSERQKLVASDAIQDGKFGVSVAIDGDTLLVGSHTQRKVYVFDRADGVWSESAILSSSDGTAAETFGISVAIDQQTLVTGAFGVRFAGTNGGAAYVFEKQAGSWNEVQRLTASEPQNPAVSAYFGVSVAVQADTILVGARLADVDGISGQGAAYVFGRSNGTWSQMQRLSAGAGSGQFGNWVAFDGDLAVISAPYLNGWQGAAYAFALVDGVWTQIHQFVADDGLPQAQYGWMTAVSGNSVLIGAVRDPVDGVGYRGSAYLYRRTVIHTVSPRATGNGSISPATPQEVIEGDSVPFTLVPDTGFAIGTIGGTCGGDLVNQIYTTAPIVDDCTVQVEFVPDPSDLVFADDFEGAP